jgi:E3 ubiquitin-protein ligase UBR1
VILSQPFTENCCSCARHAQTRPRLDILLKLLSGWYTCSTRHAAQLHHHSNLDVPMFLMSVVHHSPAFKHTATLAFETFGEARIEKLLYAYTLPFRRRAAILCRSKYSAFSFPPPNLEAGSFADRTGGHLGVHPLSDLPNQDALQNALSGWCAHCYGHSHAASSGVTLAVY